MGGEIRLGKSLNKRLEEKFNSMIPKSQKGQVALSSTVVGLIAVFILIVFGGVIIGSLWNNQQATINGITDANIKLNVTNAVIDTSEGFGLLGSLVSLVVLVIVFGLIMAIVMNSFGGFGGGAL